MTRRLDRTDRKRPVCEERMRKGKCKREERKDKVQRKLV